VLALEGVRAAYDASPRSVRPPSRRLPACHSHDGGDCSRLGARVAASQRSQVEASEQVRISAPANALTTYPLLRLEPRPRPGQRSTSAPTRRSPPPSGSHSAPASPQLSAPIRVQGDGRLGVFAFVPSSAGTFRSARPRNGAQALTGVVTGALAADASGPERLLRASRRPRRPRHRRSLRSLARPRRRHRSLRREVGGRTWRVSLAPLAPPRRSRRWAWRSRDWP
jgi:hypothetical protein